MSTILKKLLRVLTDVELVEFLGLVQEEQEYRALLAQGGDPNALNEREKILVQSGNIIDACKSHRARSGWGLKESKDLVDRYRETQGCKE